MKQKKEDKKPCMTSRYEGEFYKAEQHCDFTSVCGEIIY